VEIWHTEGLDHVVVLASYCFLA